MPLEQELIGFKDKVKSRNQASLIAPIRQFFFEHGHPHVPNLPEYESLFDLCNRIRASRTQLPGYIVDELDAMGFLWNLNLANELRWYYHYEDLKKYYAEHGDTRVPAKKGEYKALGAWVQRQRRDEKILSSDKKRLLRQIEFQWSNDIKQEKERYWKAMFKKLQAFYKKYGHANVPDRYKLDEKLGRWVSTVRSTEKQLEDWKRKLLKSVSFKFKDDIRKDKVHHRETLFKKLKEFHQVNGHANVPENYKDHKLSIFVGYLRQHPERITSAERRLLKQWNFLFSDDIKENWEKLWQKSYKKLVKFKNKFGHCRVSSAYEDQPLARWVANQRKDKKDGRLPAHREKLLRSIGFSFYEDIAALQEKKWQAMYDKLVAFKKRYGTTVVSESFKDKKLVYWVLHQRQAKEKMPDHRKKLLNKVGFIWKAR